VLVARALNELESTINEVEVVAAADGGTASVVCGTSVDEVVKAGGGGADVDGSDIATSLVVAASVGKLVGSATSVVGAAISDVEDGVVTEGRACPGAEDGVVTGGATTGADDGVDGGAA
jgi:hypothetical protein